MTYLSRLSRSKSLILTVFSLLSCQSEDPSSSSTHWITCADLADCDGVPNAVACTAGFCVDAQGQRIAAQATSLGSGGSASASGNASTGATTVTSAPVSGGAAGTTATKSAAIGGTS